MQKPLRIRFGKVDGFIKIYDGTRCLVLFCPEIYNVIYDRIEYLTREKSGITDKNNHNSTRIRIDSYNSLPVEKKKIFHNVIILIKSVLISHYYHNIFLEKGSYEDKSYTQSF